MKWIIFGLSLNLSAQFYVDTSGNDTTGDGSLGNPWASIQHAIQNVPDGSEILVRPGMYNGRQRINERFNIGVTIRSETPYRAQLRHSGTVLTCYGGKGITIEGFDIAHSGPGASALVIQVQRDGDQAEDITFRNNIIHDSYNNDLLKINNEAQNVLVEGNIFYNQSGSDEHMDVNGAAFVTIQDNIFLNDFEGSGRTNPGNTSSFIVIKNSGNVGIDDGHHIVRRNIFLNWQGSSGSNFLLLGEDGHAWYETEDILIENNLFLGNNNQVMRSSFGIKGCRDIIFRHNTIVGDLPSLAFAMRMNLEGSNQVIDNVTYMNNIWSDPLGSMGFSGSGNNDFSDTNPSHTNTFIFDNNGFWNGPNPLPEDGSELINPSDDANAIVGDPELASQAGLVIPNWNPVTSSFPSGTTTIREEFVRLAEWGRPGPTSVVLGQANPSQSPTEDLLGETRGPHPDLGAVQRQPCNLIGDVNQDNQINETDLLLALQNWGAMGASSDLNSDGIVDIIDLATLVNNLGQNCGT